MSGAAITYGNAWIVTMDDAGTEHRRGWLRVEDGLVAEVGAGDAPVDEVVAASRAVIEATRELGCTLEAPIQHLAFLALSVIPSLKLTDRGLVDVNRFELVPLEAGT